MATWQYTFFVLPKSSVSNEYLKLKFDEDNTFDDSIYWLRNPTSVLLFVEIGKIMPKGDSWSKNLLVFGNLESNCFEIYSKNDSIQSVSFRIDFTSKFEIILSQIIEFCILKGLIILDEDLNIVPLNYETIKSVITNAPQVKKYNLLSNNSNL